MLVVVGIVIGGVVVATGGSEVEAEVSGSVTSLPVVKYEGKVPVSRLVIEVSSFSFGEVVITEVSDSETVLLKSQKVLLCCCIQIMTAEEKNL